MKFSEIAYKRADIDGFIEELKKCTQKIKDAKSADEIIETLIETEISESALSSFSTIAHIRQTVNTADEFYEEEANYYAEKEPLLEEQGLYLKRALIESPFRAEVEASERIGTLPFINAELSIKTISPEIVPMLAEENKLIIEYRKLQGTLEVEFDGKKLSPSQMDFYLESNDRDLRKHANRALAAVYDANKDKYDEIYDKLVRLRTEMAQKMGYKNFIELGYARMMRNSYNEDDVKKFRDQVKNELVPFVTELKKKQAKRLGLEKLMIYDDKVMTKKGNPQPVIREKELYEAGINMYREFNDETKEFIECMDSMEMFDLYPKKGKTSGGYCTYIYNQKSPFIFANFNNTSGDVDVFTHECGHAYQAYLAHKEHFNKTKGFELMESLHGTYETCEVHSMSMEFLCWSKLERFYGDKTDMARLIHLMDALFFIPYGCMVDEFQHIMYENPNLTPAQRNEEWKKLENQYRPYLDATGIPFYGEGRVWQRQLHIYTSPFYYIDYCLAQTVALQIMEKMQKDGWDKAYDTYMSFTRLAGRFKFTELLKKAGLKSPFEDGVLSGVISEGRKYIQAHDSIL